MLRKARRNRFAAVGALCLVSMATAPAFALEPDEILKDPALEARARAISAELRCPVCQNQSIDDSNAPLSKDLRVLVRERLVAGDSDAAVKQFLVARYGEFVLLKPPLAMSTVILWATPLIVLGLAAVALIGRARRPVASASSLAGGEAPLSEEEKAALARVLGEEAKPGKS